MSFKVKLNIDWSKLKEETIRKIDERVLQAFYLACSDAVTYAKSNRGERYTDQTGALNSSTGFQLYKDGVLVEDYFELSQGGDDKDGAKAIGITAGQEAAKRRASELGAHICGVVVAGMSYAVYVESKGYDVLTGAYHEFREMLDKRMQEAFKNENIGYSIING
ncbi:MAG: hypothetical protein LBJ63_07890 [Prevotellaceae bacterium]|jgi:hypothetical protein|nr:hypothetical protein [Prevotellaceae bacterium]